MVGASPSILFCFDLRRGQMIVEGAATLHENAKKPCKYAFVREKRVAYRLAT